MKKENVYLFVPNVIGYLRLATCVWACAAMASQPVLAVGLYSVSCLLDAADGYAARTLDQHSRFGAVLDMVLDRMTTLCLLVRIAAQVHSDWRLVALVQALAGLDLVSHYAHMYASLVTGSESHKRVDPRAPYLLRLYYSSKVVLFMVCLLDQLFYISVYLLTWKSGDGELRFTRDTMLGSAVFAVGFATAIPCLVKQVLNVIQLVGAAQELVAFDEKSRAKGKRAAKQQ